MTQNSRLQYGSVSKRGKKNKVWIGRWREVVAGPDNALRTVRRSVILGTLEEIPSKRDAERELWERLQTLNVGKQGASGSMTLRRFAEEVWKPSVFPSIKLSTRLFYDHNLNSHILPAFGDVALRLLTRDGIQQWLHAKYRGGLSWNSVRHIRTVFGTILNVAEMDDLIRQNVAKKTRLPRRSFGEESPTVSLVEIRSLLEALQNHPVRLRGCSFLPDCESENYSRFVGVTSIYRRKLYGFDKPFITVCSIPQRRRGAIESCRYRR